MNKEQFAKLQKCIAHLAEGGVLQNMVQGVWDDVDYSRTINFNTEWMISGACRIKPTPKTVPLSLETWPPGLVQVRGKETGNLFLVREVTRTGVRLSNSTHVTTFSDFALCYTHPDGRPLTIEVDG